ncbi:MAG: hypothetical protein RLZZ360_297 [Candidatus Parcubacteria bacterium]|jgi:hypothetical protein
MDPMPTDQHELIIKLLRENQELVRQNNELLIRQERRERRRFIFKVIWYTILLGIPLLAYYYLYNAFIGVTTGTGTGIEVNGVTVPTTVIESLIETYMGQ